MLNLPTASPDTTFEFHLIEEDRTTRSSPGRRSVAGSSVSLSQAMVVPLTAELAKDDAGLRAMLKAEAETHVYHYVSFACSFSAAKREPFDEAWVQVTLFAAEGEPPVAYTMDPRELFDKSEISATATIGSELEFISAGAEAAIKQEGRAHYLRAFRERQHNPYWELSRTETAEIAGSFIFNLITRSPAGSPVGGELNVSGTIKKRQFLILTSREDIQSPPVISFELS